MIRLFVIVTTEWGSGVGGGAAAQSSQLIDCEDEEHANAVTRAIDGYGEDPYRRFTIIRLPAAKEGHHVKNG